MDMSQISKLLPEFLNMFRNGDSGGLQDVAAALGNNDLLRRLFSGTSRYARFLPLLPLLSKLNTEGFRGLLNNSEDISKILSVLSENQAGGGENFDWSNLIQFLPAIANLFKKETPQAAPAALPAADDRQSVKYVNPFYYIADIADKEILSALARYISRNSEN